MPLLMTTLGEVLLHIYDYDFGGAIYLPQVTRYELATPCIVISLLGDDAGLEEPLHQDCLDRGFTNWLNVAVVSDTCDEVVEPTAEALVAAFNRDCQAGGWLAEMMNYRNARRSSANSDE